MEGGGAEEVLTVCKASMSNHAEFVITLSDFTLKVFNSFFFFLNKSATVLEVDFSSCYIFFNLISSHSYVRPR